MAATSGESIKPVTAGMRRMLYVASVLVFIAGIQTYVLAGDTEQYFAWTIGIPLTAAFLGAGYFASTALEFLVARERFWANARATVPAVWTFTTLTLIATLMHFDAFHMDTARGWAWLVVYAVVPLVLGLLLIDQLRRGGAGPARVAPLPVWCLALLIGQGVVMAFLGTGLFLAPSTFDEVWAWPLTPLTGRAIGAWLIGFAIVVAQVVAENDWRRARAPMIGYLLWSLLVLLALVRYREAPAWDDLRTWLFVTFILTSIAVSAYGVYRTELAGIAGATKRRLASQQR